MSHSSSLSELEVDTSTAIAGCIPIPINRTITPIANPILTDSLFVRIPPYLGIFQITIGK